MDWEFGVNRCKQLPLEWISNEILLCSPETYISSPMMEHDHVRKRMYTRMCDRVTLLYSRKLTEHCKSAIMEKIKIIINEKKKKKERKDQPAPSTVSFYLPAMKIFLNLSSAVVKGLCLELK